MENTLSFDTFTQTLQAFATSIDADYLETKGVTEEQIRFSKSALSKWFDNRVLYPVTELWGENRESAKRQFEELYHNAFIKFKHKNWPVQFHFRHIGPLSKKFQSAGLRITCPINCGDFRFLTAPRNAKTDRKKPTNKYHRIEWPYSEIFPEGLVRDINMTPAKPDYVIRFTQTDLDKRYHAKANSQQVGEHLLRDETLQQHLSKIDKISVWQIGHFDTEEGTGQLFEMRLRGAWNEESLQTLHNFVEASLNALDQALLLEEE